MTLTAKTKEEFEKWFREKRATSKFRFWMLLNTDPNIINSVIIEWFDSVGITIDVMPILNNPLKFMPNTFWLEKEFSMTDEEVEYFKSRQEATREAIKKGNEIYNIHFSHSNQAE